MDEKRRSLVMKKKNLLDKRRPSTVTADGTIEDLYRDMDDKFRNMFLSMYKSLITSDSKCEHCNCTKQLQRCHAGKTRKQLGLKAITECLERGLRLRDDVYKHFVFLHMDEPVKILCSQCHRKFDAPEKKLTIPCVPETKVTKQSPLPEGWLIKTCVRDTGKIDKYYYSPTGKRFRSYVTAKPFF